MVPGQPLVADPYFSLFQMPGDTTLLTVLELKALIFSPLHLPSLDLFASQWENPFTKENQQRTRTVLPQGFKDSPHFFA